MRKSKKGGVVVMFSVFIRRLRWRKKREIPRIAR